MGRRGVPDQVQIMLTERCNLTCRHCAVPAEASPADHELTADDWRAVIGTFAQAGLEDLVLSGGEVTLRSDAVSLAVHAQRSGIRRTTIVTNGTRLNDRLVQELASAQAEHPKLQVHVSLDGASSATHDWMRGAGEFERTMSGLARLREAGGRVDGVHTVVHRDNVHELAEIADLAGRLGARSWTIFPIASIGRGPEVASRSLDRSGWEQLIEHAPLLADGASLELAVMGPVLGDDWAAGVGAEIPVPSRPQPDRLCMGPDGPGFACPPLRSLELGTAAQIAAGGVAEVEAVAARLQAAVDAHCRTCSFLFLCTGVDLVHPLRTVSSGQAFADPTPVGARPVPISLSRTRR